MEEEKLTKLDPTALVPLIAAGVDVTELTIRTPDTIGRELHLLQQRRDRISVYFGARQSSFLSVLQSIDDEHQTFSFDISVDEALNFAFERASGIVIAAISGGIKIQFEIPRGIKKITDFDGRPSFQAQFPAALIKLERRQFFRVPQRNAKPLVFSMRDPKGNLIDAQLHDLSIGGIGLVLTSDADVELGDICTECRIDLGTCGIVEVTLAVITKRQVVKQDATVHTVVGTHFVDLGRNAENLLLRHIRQLERERHRARRK